MPSSISDSRHRAPRGAWGKTYLLAAVLVFAVSLALEMFWRGHNFKPENNTALHSPITWRRVLNSIPKQHGRETVVIIGSSRALMALDPEIIKSQSSFPDARVYQLSTWLSKTLPVLDLLVNVRGFSGTIIAEITPVELGSDESEGLGALFPAQIRAKHWVSYFEQLLRLEWQRHVVFTRDRLSILGSLEWLSYTHGLKPVPSHYVMQPDYLKIREDRFIEYNASPITGRSLEQTWAPEFEQNWESLSETEIQQKLIAFQTLAAKLQERGGRIFFIRLNSCGAIRAAEDRYYPRSKFYDRFAESVREGQWLHFEDDPVLKDLPCADGSHLNYPSARKASTRIARLFLNN